MAFVETDIAVCRRHFVLVSSVINIFLLIIWQIFTPVYYYYGPMVLWSLISILAFWSSIQLKAYLLWINTFLLFADFTTKVIVCVVIANIIQNIQYQCNTGIEDAICHYNSWITMLNNSNNALVFLIISTLINLFNMFSFIYLIYSLRVHNKSKSIL